MNTKKESHRGNGEPYPSQNPLKQQQSTPSKELSSEAADSLTRDESNIRGFVQCPIPLWEGDFSRLKEEIDALIDSGISDFERYILEHPECVEKWVALIEITHINEKTAELFADSGEDSLLEALPLLFFGDSGNLLTKMILQFITGTTLFESEIINTTQKEDLHLLFTCSLISRHEKTWKQVCGSLIDITSFKKLEKSLREREENYRNMVERANDGIVIVMDEKIQYVNPRLTDMLGYAKESLLHTNPFQYIHPEDISRTKDLYTRRLAGEDIPSVYEVRLRKKDGTYLPVELNAGLTIFQGNTADLVVIRNMSESKMVEKALRQSRERYRSLIECAPDGIVVLDMKGTIVECNSMALEVTGLSQEEVIGTHFTKLRILRKRDIPTYIKIFTSIIRGNPTPAFEVSWVDDQDQVNYSEIRVGLLKEEGKVVGIQAIARNINERKHREEQIKSSLKEKETLLKEVHHRVKNNMQVISSLLSIQSRYVTDEKTREMFKESQNRIRSMALVHEKLYQSKQLTNINFREYIDTLITDLSHSYGLKPNRIDINLDIDEVPLTIDEAIICGLIINELISNAFTHAFPGDRKGTITVSLHEEGDNFHLAVADTGIGLPSDFDVDKSKSLGLRLVNILARDQLKGSISVREGEGTEISIRVPLSS
jgi:PAS domain S-box-containing protein